MSAGRSDASTSTDDVKGRPLCLFYFTHPFGVLSPEPPRMCAAPASLFLNMEPVSPFYFTSSEESCRGGSGAARARRPSASSSLVSSEVWVSAGAGEWARRAMPYARMLPPLRLPSPRDLPDYAEEEVWPRRPPQARYTLPPLRLPAPTPRPQLRALPPYRAAPPSPPPAPRSPRTRRSRGVRKPRSRRLDVRRVLASLMRRAVRGGGGCRAESPALREVLHVLREAWHEPRHLARKHSAASKQNGSIAGEQSRKCSESISSMERRDASPGMLRRRYSVPETIMRRYRLAQLRSESEDTASCSRYTAVSACASPPREPSCSPGESPTRFLRRDRELMRKSALLRRMWTRPPPACRCCEEDRTSRSLQGSHSELRQPWTSPKRQRLDERPPPHRATADFSDSTFQSHMRGPSSCDDTMTDAFTDSEEGPSVALPTTAPPISHAPAPDDNSFTESDTFSASVSTAKETNGSVDPLRLTSPSPNEEIESRVDERRTSPEHKEQNLRYEKMTPLVVDTGTSPYELLEVVVTETVNTPLPLITVGSHERTTRATETPAIFSKPPHLHDINIDEYVSNILVESLNSLTDQLECMNASIGNDRRVNIVEKEIKVKLQNTGVNTIVHLSPTSNNQIIFGNEEICNDDGQKDECNNPRELVIRTEPESNNNMSPERGFDAIIQHDNVNKAVLQQIQKLFQDELQQLDPHTISHIEVSNVDVYIDSAHTPDSKPEDVITVETALCVSTDRLISGVGAGNYFHDTQEAAVVPRFSAYPHTDSMEVNTSSSEDAELISDCTSLVDSLDDPNSPRSVMMRRAYGARRGELVRSAIDVLDLLPESMRSDSAHTRDKGEAFFVKIKDDDYDCDKENVKVAEYMPEKIKQRLFRRHRKRELRMECARRGKVKQMKKELEARRQEELVRGRREVERECRAVVDALIDEIMAKIVQDEYKCMRIKQRNNKLKQANSEENLTKRNRRKEIEIINNNNHVHKSRKSDSSSHSCSYESLEEKVRKSERYQIHGKLLARPSLPPSGRAPRRFYQKSEIHEGDKCIEILEILEYVNGSQSSPDTTNSDESLSQTSRNKKSRIPVPVAEKSQRQLKDAHMRLTGGDGRRGSPEDGGARALADMLLQALGEREPAAPRSRSNSLRFKRVFDIIPEERSLSVASSPEQRTRSAATSPRAAPPPREQTTMTDSHTKSAATSPARPAPPPERSREGVREVEGPMVVKTPPQRTRGSRGEERAAERRPPAPAPAPRRAPPRRAQRTDSESRDDARRPLTPEQRPPQPPPPRKVGDSKNSRGWDKSRAVEGTSSDSGDSGGSLLCSLAPRWLSATRPRRRPRRAPAPPPILAAPAPPITQSQHDTSTQGTQPQPPGGWSVTVAGSCRSALPADLEMRLRFPPERAGTTGTSTTRSPACSCVQCASCARRGPSPPRHALPPAAPVHEPPLTLTLKKEAQDSSIIASKSLRKSSEQLPELETYRASRSKVKSSVKTRRGYSLHCWVGGGREPPADQLSVLGSAIIPELKPRVPTMSERDLTRVYTPRHYLRS